MARCMDLDVAGRNYAAAAKQNFAPAQFLLAQLIEQGKGSKTNLVSAYVLATRAAGAKDPKMATKKAEEVKKLLTPAQLAEAENGLKTGSNP